MSAERTREYPPVRTVGDLLGMVSELEREYGPGIDQLGIELVTEEGTYPSVVLRSWSVKGVDVEQGVDTPTGSILTIVLGEVLS